MTMKARSRTGSAQATGSVGDGGDLEGTPATAKNLRTRGLLNLERQAEGQEALHKIRKYFGMGSEAGRDSKILEPRFTM